MHKIKLSLDIESADSTVFDIITAVNTALNELRNHKVVKRMTGTSTMSLEGKPVTLDTYMFSRADAATTETPAVRRYAPRKNSVKAREQRQQHLRSVRIERAMRMQAQGAAANKASANAEAFRVGPLIDEAMRLGKSAFEIAEAMNMEGLRTRQGKPFTQVSVPVMHSRYIRLLEEATSPVQATPTSSETYASTVNF